MQQQRAPRAGQALLTAAFALSFSPTVPAVDIHYARAIGDPYEYRAAEAPVPAAEPAGARDPALPQLGADAPAPVARQSGSNWSRVLIGVLVVGAVAALANSGSGEGDVQVSTGVDLGGGAPLSPGGATAPAPSTGAPTSSAPPSSEGASGGSGSNDTGRSDDKKGKNDDKGKSDKKGGK